MVLDEKRQEEVTIKPLRVWLLLNYCLTACSRFFMQRSNIPSDCCCRDALLDFLNACCSKISWIGLDSKIWPWQLQVHWNNEAAEFGQHDVSYYRCLLVGDGVNSWPLHEVVHGLQAVSLFFLSFSGEGPAMSIPMLSRVYSDVVLVNQTLNSSSGPCLAAQVSHCWHHLSTLPLTLSMVLLVPRCSPDVPRASPPVLRSPCCEGWLSGPSLSGGWHPVTF